MFVPGVQFHKEPAAQGGSQSQEGSIVTGLYADRRPERPSPIASESGGDAPHRSFPESLPLLKQRAESNGDQGRSNHDLEDEQESDYSEHIPEQLSRRNVREDIRNVNDDHCDREERWQPERHPERQPDWKMQAAGSRTLQQEHCNKPPPPSTGSQQKNNTAQETEPMSPMVKGVLWVCIAALVFNLYLRPLLAPLFSQG